MNLKTISSLLIIVIIVGIYFVFFKNTNFSQKNQDVFIVGTVANYAPFVSVNSQGEYEGFDIDIAIQLAQNMGKKLIIKDLGSMAPLFIALEQESVDAIIWALSITQERLKKVTMIRYQGTDTNSYSLIFWKEIPTGISTTENMNGLTVCVEPASSQDKVLNKYPLINKKSTEKVDDALLDIQFGKANAALVEPAIAKKFKNKYPEIQILDVPLEPEDQEKGMGIAIKKNNALLAQKIQTTVESLQQEGIIQNLAKKWNVS